MVEIDVVMSLSLAGKSHVVFAFAIPDGAPMSKLLPIGVYGIACVEINSKEDAVMAGVRAEILITYWSNKQQEH